jgi:hypothetical protein
MTERRAGWTAASPYSTTLRYLEQRSHERHENRPQPIDNDETNQPGPRRRRIFAAPEER